MEEVDFERVVDQGRQLQARLADLAPVAVGGTAEALHCGHRFSLDVDVVTPGLAPVYEDALARLESWEGWRTNRSNPRVLILGERCGVELGVRQQRRPVPLQVTCVEGLVVPTAAETLRVKAFLLAQRRATRDFVDVAALVEHVGFDGGLKAMRWLNVAYGPASPLTWALRFAEACEDVPADAPEVPLATYRGLRAPFTNWSFVAGRCRNLGRALAKAEMENRMPVSAPAGLDTEEDP